jgi:hypothetical protein
VYKVQAKDKDGERHDYERWEKETHLNRASYTPKIAPSAPKIVGRAQQMQTTEISTLDTAQQASDPSGVHYLEERAQEDANYQVKWNNWMSDGRNKSFYKHVFVLLLSWHPECNDMADREEVTHHFEFTPSSSDRGHEHR